MKILFLTHQFFPEYQTGTERFVLNNALMAQKFGNKVKVVTYSYYENAFYDQEIHGILYKEFFYEGIPVLAFKFKRIPENINLVLENKNLSPFAKSVLEVEAPDIIHVGHSMRMHEFIWSAINLGIPYIITSTDFFLLCPKINLTPDKFSLCSGPKGGKACAKLCPELDRKFISRRLEAAEKILKNAKDIVAPSEFVAQIYKQEFPILSFEIIPHGIRYHFIKNNDRVYDKESKITFGYLGNLIYHKGVHVLLSAFKSIETKNSSLKIYGFGQQKFIKKLKEISNNDKRVSFQGLFASEKLGNVLSDIDVLINPSISYETYSFTLHEALACDVPVIASNIGVMGEVIVNNFNGFTFSPGDALDLAHRMEEIIKNPAILNDLKQNIKNQITIPTIEQEAYAYTKLYKNFHS
ncbi:MAG: glycosyltransferase [Brevefilum sp.]|nr:glycosyltransferase [Brevefilum sp.]